MSQNQNDFPGSFGNVFVLCAGRCGSVSFAKACSHFTNYTSGHETRHGKFNEERVNFANGHIEVDNRLAWFLGRLQETYGEDAFYVHLIRDQRQVAASYDRRWHHRGSLIQGFDQAILRNTLPHDDTGLELVRTIDENIRCFLRDKPHVMTIDIDQIEHQFPVFAQRVGAHGEIQNALAEFSQRHNTTAPNNEQKSKHSLPIVRLTIANRKLKKKNRVLKRLAAPGLILLSPLIPVWLLVHLLRETKMVSRLRSAVLRRFRPKGLICDAFLAHHAQGSKRAIEMLGSDAPAGAVELFQALNAKSDQEWIDEMERWSAATDRPNIQLHEGTQRRYNRLQFKTVQTVASPEKVSVIMPVFNAEQTVQQAADSILAQTWHNLELLIVDDKSTDRTPEIIERIASADSRVRIFHNPRNVGPFVSKNRALQSASGRYVTGHDADDIAVPTRIFEQMEPILRDGKCAATLAYMIRVDRDGLFSFPSDVGAYSYDGVAKVAMISLLVERELLTSTLGYWDGVRFGGDSEMLCRVKAYLGSRFQEVKKVVMLCLDEAGSLTNDRQHGVTVWDGASPVRNEYRQEWSAWHKATSSAKRYVPFPHLDRLFSVPAPMLVPNDDVAEIARCAAYDDVLQQRNDHPDCDTVPCNHCTPRQPGDRPRRIGIVAYWFNRGQAVVARRIRQSLDEAGFETFVLARPTKSSFVKSSFVDQTGVWEQDRVTAASQFEIPEQEYLRWAAENRLDAVLFDQNLQFAEIASLRHRGIRTIARFVWEAFGPDDARQAVDSFDVIYSLTRGEQERYRSFGIESPRVRWGCPPELTHLTRPARSDDEVRFYYPGGYLSDRKPTAEVIEAFRGVKDPRARLIIKVQHPKLGPQLAKQAHASDPRIRVIVEDLPTEQHHQLMASCDVCLAPTRWEGLGLHHCEAIALGLPCITNDFAPMNENVTHGIDGYLIPAVWTQEQSPGVPRLETPVDALRDGIDALCDDSFRQFLVTGVEDRRETMSWRNTVADLVELITEPQAKQSHRTPLHEEQFS